MNNLIWKNLNEILVRRQMSMTELAKKSGIPRGSLYNMNKGSVPSYEMMCKIADTLNISLDAFRKEAGR